MPERTPEVEGRVSLAAKDGSPSSAFNDTAMVSVYFLKNTDGNVSLNDVAIQVSRSLA
jgi:hypothetical protein